MKKVRIYENMHDSFNPKGALSLHYMKNCIDYEFYKEKQKKLEHFIK